MEGVTREGVDFRPHPGGNEIMSTPRSGTARGQAGRDCDCEAKLQLDSTVTPLPRQPRDATSVRRRALMLFAAAGCVGVERTRDRILAMGGGDA
jgi:hypothetical protein